MREKLFYDTVKYARSKSYFYRQLYQGIDLAGKNYRDDLQRLPIINTKIVAENQNEILCRPADIVTHIRTSGTTDHPHLTLFKTESDLVPFDFGHRSKKSKHKRKLNMYVCDMFHGLPANLTNPMEYSVHFDSRALPAAMEFLLKDHNLPGVESRVSRLLTSFANIKVFTKYLLDNQVDVAGLGLEFIAVDGGYVPPRWKQLISRLWKTKLFDIYSMSEIKGSVVTCSECSYYHPQPALIAEVVSVDDLQPIQEGLGVLIMTSLYPFETTSPMIRYYTGDLFQVSSGNCVDLCLRPRGRLEFSFQAKSKRRSKSCIVPSGDLIDIIEELPDLSRFSEGPAMFGREEDSYWGAPKFKIRANWFKNHHELSILLQLNYDSLLYPHRPDEMRSTIVEGLCQRNPTLKEWLAGGDVTVKIDFEDPGSRETFKPAK